MRVLRVIAGLAALAFFLSCAADKSVHRERGPRDESPPERLRIRSGSADNELSDATRVLVKAPSRRPGDKPDDPEVTPAPEPAEPEPELADAEAAVLADFDRSKQQGAARSEQRKSLKAKEAALLKKPFSQAVVHELIKCRLPDVNYCYDLVVSSGVNVAGEVVVDFLIDAEGRVAEANPKATLQHEGVVTCVVNTVLSWTFPKPTESKEVAVSYPFEFRLAR